MPKVVSYPMRHKRLFKQALDFHKRHQWDLNSDGVYVPHVYTDRDPDAQSWWDDFGFVYAKRRIMVWWQHPRMIYMDRLESAAMDACAEHYPPQHTPWSGKPVRIRRHLKHSSRSKTVGYRMPLINDAYRAYFDKVNAVQDKMSVEDHGWEIRPSASSCVLRWGQGVDFIFPDEVRNEKDLSVMRDKVVAILRGDTSMLREAPVYTFTDWKRDNEHKTTWNDAFIESRKSG